MARARKSRSRSSRSRTSPARSSSSKRALDFPYIAIHDGPARPALPIVIHSTRTRLAVRALVDSGADYSLLPTSYASYLGVDLAACERIPCTTAGGTAFVFVHPIPLEAEIEPMNVHFAMKSAFTEHAKTILLGREDFFSGFRVVIEEAVQTVTLEKI